MERILSDEVSKLTLKVQKRKRDTGKRVEDPYTRRTSSTNRTEGRTVDTKLNTYFSFFISKEARDCDASVLCLGKAGASVPHCLEFMGVEAVIPERSELEMCGEGWRTEIRRVWPGWKGRVRKGGKERGRDITHL